MSILIKNGTLVTTENEFVADILVEDEQIVQIGRELKVAADEVIDAAGKYILPGGVDEHVHFSFEFKGARVKGFETSNAAAVGGTTTVIEFVNQIKGKGLIESLDEYRSTYADGISCVDYSFHAVGTDPTEIYYEDLPRLVEAGYPTIKLFMAYKGLFFHADDDMIAKTMMICKDHGITMMTHCENADLIDVLQKDCIERGETGPYGHALSRPPIVETEATQRAINIAKMAKSPLFIVHVTTKGAVDAIKQAKAEGWPIKGETCTHYLLLDKSDLARGDFEGAKYVCSPALREQEDRDYLWQSIKHGWLEAVSSDHCGFSWKEQKTMGKDDFRDIPNGAPGMENRLGMLWSYGVVPGKISRSDLVSLFATTPAAINGLDHIKGSLEVGKDADIVIYDPDGEYTVSVENSLQGTDFNSYEGFKQYGRVETVFLRGKKIVEDSKYIGKHGQGKFLKAKPYGLLYR